MPTDDNSPPPLGRSATWDRITKRVYEALEPFHLPPAQKDRTALRILKGIAAYSLNESSLNESRLTSLANSETYFDFSGKLQRMVRLFASVRNASGQPILTYENLSALAFKNPIFFLNAPDTMASNIFGVARHYANEGLTAADYLQAAMQTPSLFGMPSPAVANNIDGVVHYFAAEGLTARVYLPIALKHPPLFYQLPTTIIRHVNGFTAIQEEGLLRISRPQQAMLPRLDTPRAQTLDFLLRNPMVLSMADETIALRFILAAVSEKPVKRPFPNKELVSQQLMTYLDTLDHLPTQPDTIPTSGPIAEILKQRAHVLLAYMAQAGLLDPQLTTAVQAAIDRSPNGFDGGSGGGTPSGSIQLAPSDSDIEALARRLRNQGPPLMRPQYPTYPPYHPATYPVAPVPQSAAHPFIPPPARPSAPPPPLPVLPLR